MVKRSTLLAALTATLLATAAPALGDAPAAAPAAQSAASREPAYNRFIEAGRLAGATKNYAEAEWNYRQAIALETKASGENSFAVGETLAELALQVSNQGRFQEAADLFQRATPIIEASSSDAARARLASYRALDAANQRNYADALKYAREASTARRSEIAAAQSASDAPVSQGELAHSLRIEASMALRLGDLASARAAGEEALFIVSQDSGLPLWWRPEVVSLMGEINEADGRVINAERDYRDARDLDQKLFGDTAPTAMADLRLGHFYSGQQVYGPAVESYRAGFAILAKDSSARAEVVPDQIVPYITAMADGGSANDAEIFRASQLSGASVADQTIARVAARKAATTPALAELVQQAQDAEQARDNARVDLAAEFAKADDERDNAREEKLQNDVTLASARADQLFGQVAQQYPQYASLASSAPAELKDVQAQLRPGEALVSFVTGIHGGYALLVTQQGFTAQPLDITSTQAAVDIAYLRNAFEPKLGKLPDFSIASSYALYKALLAPLEAKLAGVDHLIVAPGAGLDNLPFALLVTEAPARGSEHAYGKAAWLVRRMAVSQVPSPRAFVALRAEAAHRAAAAKPFLGLGDPSFSGAKGPAGAKALAALADACRVDGPADPSLLRALSPLPDTARELETVGAHFGGGTILLGADATEANLRAQPLDQYATLYFATHGLLPGELHCASEPSLALSPPASMPSSTDADGILSASEIAGLKLNADLVVLSACNTAVSSSGPGGGSLEGLANSFFAAGARAVLATEWEVPSTSTTRLMTAMFAHGRGNAETLRQAQLELISQPATAHPFHWAAFTLIGDNEGAASSARADAANDKGGRS